MTHLIDIRPVVSDHFRPYRLGSHRKLSWVRLWGFVFIPTVIATGISFWRPMGAHTQQTPFMTVYALVAAVLVALLPVIQTVIGYRPVDLNYDYNECDRPLWREQVIRLQVLRELYAETSFATLISVLSLGPILLAGASIWPHWVQQVFSAITYFVGASLAISCLHIITNIYLVLDNQAKEVSRILTNKGPDVKRQPHSPSTSTDAAA